MKNKLRGYAALATAAILWGGMYVVSKYSLDYIQPFSLIFLRYSVALIPITIIYIYKKTENKEPQRISRKNWGYIVLVGGTGYFLSILFQFIGTDMSDAHTGALITAAAPAMILVFSRIILKEQMDKRKIFSVVLSTIGIFIIVGFQVEKSYVTGSLILFLAAVSWSFITIIVKKVSADISILRITMLAMAIALFMSFPFALWENLKKPIILITGEFILLVLYIGLFATAGAFFLWNYGISKVDTGTGALFYFLQPVVAAILGAVLLNEIITINFYIGGLMILTSIVFSFYSNKKTENQQTYLPFSKSKKQLY